MANTTARAIRVPDNLWEQALAAAHERGETVSEVVRVALERYVDEHQALRVADAERSARR